MEGKIEKENKKFGIGTLSPIIAVAAIIFSHLYITRISVGQELLNFLRISISAESITLIGFATAIILGIKYNKDKFAKAGIVIVVVLLLGGIALTLIGMLFKRIF